MKLRWTLLIALIGLPLLAQTLTSGVDFAGFDSTYRAQDNFYYHVNGNWLKQTKIPDDLSNYGSFTVLYEQAQENLRQIIEDAANNPNHPRGSDLQKVGDMYKSFMDTTHIEALGMTPILSDLNAIDTIKSSMQLSVLTAKMIKSGIQTPLYLFVNQDPKNATSYIAFLNQSGTGLPDKDYYFKENFAPVREAYRNYIARLATLANLGDADSVADIVLAIESDLAAKHWTRVENRDRDKTYNKYATADLQTLMPNFSWQQFFDALEVERVAELIVRQPSYFEALDSILQTHSIDEWKMYYKFKIVADAAPYLSSAFVDTDFEFYGKVLSGVNQNRARWKRGVSVVEAVLGEVLGRLYVGRHFKPESKARMLEMVKNLQKAFEVRIKNLEWMSNETKEKALEKLAKFNFKIGYPDKWKDYSALSIEPNDLIGNLKRSQAVEFNRMISKLGQPIDRTEWHMTPQTVNAYYNPPMNEIVFPAAILQPPFFDVNADDAINYGAIGAVIGHEFSHGFDDQGRKSDGDGNLRDWWTEEDARQFKARAQKMIDQYNQYMPIDSMHVNGELTLGENIADLAGLTVAFEAYQISINGKPAPRLDGLTGEQRFFIGWAQIWRRKYRDEELKRRLLTDPHSPSEYRVNGIVSNMPAFYNAYDVKPGDGMYRSEDVRVQIW
jgi:predicted metalloendopeptidase